MHRNPDGEEVRVYQEFDKDSAKPVGKPTFMHLHEEGAEEVDMVPAEFDIDDFPKRQDMWLLYPPDALENQLNLRCLSLLMMPFFPKNGSLQTIGSFIFNRSLNFFGTGKKKTALWVSKQQKPFRN